MQTLFHRLHSPSSPGPLYVRYEAGNGPFAIELKLDIVRAVAAEIDAAGSTPVEIGGILIGVLPTEANPVLRINEVQLLPRRAGDQGIFLPDPREHDQFVLARWDAGNRGRAPVGFFRTHRRGGPMRPSLADRTLLAGEFDTTAYALLLIDPVSPRTASFFVGSAGELSDRPSVPPFQFEPAALGALPIHEPDSTSRSEALPTDGSHLTASRTESSVSAAAPRRNGARIAAMMLLCVAALAAAYAWSDLPSTALLGFAGAADPELSVTGDRVLHILWNRDAASVRAAAAAKLTIAEGESRRELLISADELRSGAVEYQRSTNPVRVTLTLEMPSVNVTQTIVAR